MSYPVNEILRNFFSVVAGVTLALVIIIPSALFAAFLNNPDSAIPTSQEILSTLLLISGIVAGCMLGGYTTVKVSTRKDIIHAFITGIVLTILYALKNDFEFDWRYPDTGIAYVGFIPIVMIGGIIGVRKKRTRLNNHSSLPGTP